MSLAELLPAALAMSEDDKRSLLRALEEDLAKTDPLTLFPTGVEIPMWSPIEAYEAAAQLQQLLDAERAKS